MSIYIPEALYAYAALEDLSDKEGYAVKIGTTGGDRARAVRVCTSGADFLGVVLLPATVFGAAQTAALTSMSGVATIQESGVAKAVAQANITQGANVTVHTDGRFRAATTGEVIVGRAEEAAVAGKTFALNLRVRGGVV